MYSQQQSSDDPALHPVGVELHGLDAGVSLQQLRQLCSQAGPCLQVLAALEGGEAGSGLALAVFASEPAAAQACDLLNNYPLGSSFLRVQRAQSLPGQLIDLLWSVHEPSVAQAQAQAQAQAAADVAQASAAAVQTAAYLREQQQQFLEQQRQVAAQRQAWQEQVWGGGGSAGSGGGGSAVQTSNTSGSPPPSDPPPGNSKISLAMFAAQQQQLVVQQQQLEELQADLRHMQLDQQRQQNQLSGQQRQLTMQAATQAGQQRQLSGQQHQLHQQQSRQGPQSWANAAAQPPSLAALARRPFDTVAATLAAGHHHNNNNNNNNSGSNESDEWQTAVASQGRHGRRHGAAGGNFSGSGGNGDSSVSSDSPHHTPPPSLSRRSDEKMPRPGGQDGASAEPTTKLWMGGIDGSASAETVRTVFGRFGPIYDYELQPATHEKGRTDQWGFVNFKRLVDATTAYEQLVGEVIPELTGTRKLKLQFRPVDGRRGTTRR